VSRLVLYTRAGCHLCDEAKAALDRITSATGVSWTEIDIAGDRHLTAEHGDLIPVLTVDGRTHGYWRVDEQRLLQDLGR
jgi:glutaredoxin